MIAAFARAAALDDIFDVLYSSVYKHISEFHFPESRTGLEQIPICLSCRPMTATIYIHDRTIEWC